MAALVCAAPVDAVPAAAAAARVVYEPFRDESQMREIVALIERDLSEPYSVFTYRYFIWQWPQLCLLVRGPGARSGRPPVGWHDHLLLLLLLLLRRRMRRGGSLASSSRRWSVTGSRCAATSRCSRLAGSTAGWALVCRGGGGAAPAVVEG